MEKACCLPKANYIDYMKLWNKLYCGVALSEEKLSDNVRNIAGYLRDGGAAELMKDVGIGIKTTITDRVKTEMVYISGENKGRTLTIREIENIGILLLMYYDRINKAK